MCLQEVDDHVFENDLQPILSMEGYAGVFHKKGNSVREGLACFVNTNRFRLIFVLRFQTDIMYFIIVPCSVQYNVFSLLQIGKLSVFYS